MTYARYVIHVKAPPTTCFLLTLPTYYAGVSFYSCREGGGRRTMDFVSRTKGKEGGKTRLDLFSPSKQVKLVFYTPAVTPVACRYLTV